MRRAGHALSALLLLVGCGHGSIGVAARLEPERAERAPLLAARVEAVSPAALPAPLREALTGSSLRAVAVTLHALDPAPLRLARPTTVTLRPPGGAPRPLLSPDDAMVHLLAEAELAHRAPPSKEALLHALEALAAPLESDVPAGEARRAIRLVELETTRLPGLGLTVTVLQDGGPPVELLSRLSPP